MIVTELYDGQGLGNQLFCYVTTRVLAADKGLKFGIQSPEKFKGKDFIKLDFGEKVVGGSGPEGGPPHSLPEGIKHYYSERKISHPNGSDLRTYDGSLVDIPDHTKIDGVLQDEQYLAYRKDEIREWLKVDPTFECHDYASDDYCVINFRGGEYANYPELFLTQKYWNDAISEMRKKNPQMQFVVVTDDVKLAKRFFPKFPVSHKSIANDYVIIKNAHYLILSNSSFAWFPAWLNQNLKFCIAPKYWTRHNISDGYWSCMYNLTTGWEYLDREGKLFDHSSCKEEQENYIHSHPELFVQPKTEENFLVVTSYQNDLSWVPEYTNNYLVYDRSEAEVYPPNLDRKKVRKQPNIGYNLYDYFTFIIDHYDNLPNCTIFMKGNTFPRHISQEYFNRIMNNQFFTPIEDFQRHNVKWPISFFDATGGFCERNSDWYLKQHPARYFDSYNSFLKHCFQEPVLPRYLRFPPGANFIVPKENILKLPKVFYENLRTFVAYTQLPGEAHIIERALFTLWTASFELNENMLRPLDATFVFKPTKHTGLKKLKDTMKNIFGKSEPLPIPHELADYRKTVKVYDIFTFFNELELLEMRLNILGDVVDYFVIIECGETFSGKPKELVYAKNKQRFAKFKDKIIHYVVTNVPKSREDLQKRLESSKISYLDKEIITNALTSDNVPEGQLHWLKEFYQKESIKKALVKLNDNDICFVSDVDEIWNPNLVLDYRKNDIFKLRQIVYSYYLNNRSNEAWAGTLMTKFINIKNGCLNHLRTVSKTKYTYIENGGWHFTNQGGADRIRKKLESYGHQEFNNDSIKSDLENKISNNKDFVGRKFKFWTDNENLPEYLKNHKEKYRDFFKP